MLGIDMRMLPTIAEQKTEHSWLLPIMEAAKNWEWEQDEKAEDLLSDWVTEQVEKEGLSSYSMAARIVQDSLMFLLEKEAIAKAKEKHPDWEEYLPEILSAREAAMMAAMEQPYDTSVDEEVATRLLQRMEDGSLQPSKELISQITAL